MAEINDAEIKIGVSINSDEFIDEYNVLLNKVNAKTKDHISDAVDNVSGAVSKSWGEFPFADMHNKTGGAKIATQAFLGSLAKDLEARGVGQGSLGFQSALLNASHIASTPDPWQRFHQMLASGLTQQADLTHPDTVLGQTIETDYELMKQSWSRDFIKKSKKGRYIDFAGMREYAVDAGLGRWKDEESDHTADNFELINNELEDINENSDKASKGFKGWGDDLKNVLGTLTAIGSAIAKFGIAAITGAVMLTEKSEKGVVEAGTTLDKRRAYVGMSALDELSAQVASQSVGLGKDAITNEIITMSSNREKYQLLGEGLNALYPSLTGIFDNIMSSENPMDTYKSILKEVYDNMRGADQDTRAQTLMLLESQGLGSAAQVIGAMLSNESLAKDLGYDPTNLFTLRANGYYGSFEKAETMLPALAQLNASLKASYSQLYTDFTEAFGKPFKTWWDDVLKDKVIPWFEKFIEWTGAGKSEAYKEVNTQYKEIVMRQIKGEGLLPSEMGALAERNAILEASPSLGWYIGYTAQDALNLGDDKWNDKLKGNMGLVKGNDARKLWLEYRKIATASDKGLSDEAIETRNRIAYMVDTLQETGLDTFLADFGKSDMDAYLLKALQMGAAGGDDWKKTFEDYIDKTLSAGIGGERDDTILAILQKIAENTEQREELFKRDDLWTQIEHTYGSTVANQWKASLQRQ